MNWPLVHGIAEEVELWTTIAINLTLIFGAVPIGIAILRRVPWKRVERVAFLSAGTGLIGTTIFALAWFFFAPYPFQAQECQRIADLQQQTRRLQHTGSNDDEAARIIILGYASSNAGCLAAGGN